MIRPWIILQRNTSLAARDMSRSTQYNRFNELLTHRPSHQLSRTW